MAEAITKERLQKEIAEILENASLDKTSTKKVIQKLEKKLGVDLTDKKKMIDQLVMDYVNSMDSDDSMDEEEEVLVKKKKKKADVDEEDERDDSNDSDWGDDLLQGSVDHNYPTVPQEPTISTSQRTHHHLPDFTRARKAIILKRVSHQTYEEDESDLFGKLTAKKLRKLPEEQRDLLMIQINQLFYEKNHNRPYAFPMPSNRQDFTLQTPLVGPLTPTQIQAKKIFRVKSLPKGIASPNILKQAALPSSPPNETASANSAEPRNSCNIV